MSSATFVAMRRADGSKVSEVHFEGHIVKPDQKTGIVLVPADQVIAMFLAGYIHATPTT